VSEKDATQFDTLILDLQKRISSENFDALAWSFPAKARKLTFEKSKHFFHPGSFVVFKNCD
jgi:hypothetical protein